jgi:hypothetical protein
MKPIIIFIGYNSNTDKHDVNTAIRLSTILNVSNCETYLPCRCDSILNISDETKIRMKRSEYFFFIIKGKPNKITLEEIEYASNCHLDKKKKRIFIITDKLYTKLQSINKATYLLVDKDYCQPNKYDLKIKDKVKSTVIICALLIASGMFYLGNYYNKLNS